MKTILYLTGDINLMGLAPQQDPFIHLKDELKEADLIFSNLECCFFNTPHPETIKGREGFYVPTRLASHLKEAGISAVGMANNVNFGPKAIRSSIKQLDSVGVFHAGAGENRAEAHRPIIIDHHGQKVGFMQRSSIFWPFNHAALDDYPGIATLPAHTAYEPTLPHKPGSPPIVHTWADPQALEEFKEEINQLKEQVDIVISSHHWGLKDEVYGYQKEIAHAAVDAGADIVMGHGAHQPLPVEIYQDRPIFYGLAHFFFLKGHGGKRQIGDGLLAKITLEDGAIHDIRFSMVETDQHNEAKLIGGETLKAKATRLNAASRPFGTTLSVDGDEIICKKRSI